jgi:hypothetical protein
MNLTLADFHARFQLLREEFIQLAPFFAEAPLATRGFAFSRSNFTLRATNWMLLIAQIHAFSMKAHSVMML